MILRRFMKHVTDQNWFAVGHVALLFVIFSASLFSVAADDMPAKPSADALKELDQRVEAFMKENTVPGVLIAVASHGKMIDLRTYGYANVELSSTVTADTVFEMGSVSKQFLVVAALMLVEEGKLKLDEPIHKYLPFLPSDWIGITPYQLMTHTSGIPDYEEIRSYDVYRFRLTPEEIIRIAHSRPVDFLPGQGWYYSNTGYFLMSMIVERIEGKPLGDVLKDRIFDPLEMTQTRFADPEAIIPHRAAGYWVNKVGDLINRNPTETSSTLAAGGLLSSADDMVKWDAALYDNTLLTDKSKKLMWTKVDVPSKTNDWSYAMGWSLETYKDLRVQWHDGLVAGFSTRFRRFPDENLMTLIFVNRYRVRTKKLEEAMLHTFIPKLGPIPE